MRNHPSRSLDDICTESRICAQLSTNPSMDITHFWREVESAALPLMTKSSSNTENREVTFLWRSEEVLQGVYLRLNRVTDKRDVKKGLMTHIPSTNIWTLTLELPASYLSLIHISEPTRLGMISYAVFCLKKKKKK